MNRRNFGKLLLGAIPALCLAKKAEAKALPTTKGPDGTFTFSVPARGGYTADSLGNRKPNILEFNIWVEHKWACGHTQTYRSPGYDDPRGLMFNKAVDHELLYPAPYDNVFHFADPEPCKACQTKAAWKTEPIIVGVPYACGHLQMYRSTRGDPRRENDPVARHVRSPIMGPDCRKKELESETNKFSLDTLRRRLYAVSDATGKLPESVTITRKEFMSAFRKGDTASKGFTILVGNGMDEGQTRIAGAVTDD